MLEKGTTEERLPVLFKLCKQITELVEVRVDPICRLGLFITRRGI